MKIMRQQSHLIEDINRGIELLSASERESIEKPENYEVTRCVYNKGGR